MESHKLLCFISSCDCFSRHEPDKQLTYILEGLDVVDEDVLVAADEGAEELAEPVQLVQALKIEK